MQDLDPSGSAAPETSSTDSQPTPVVKIDKAAEAEKLKEQGNVSFKSKLYGSAIDLYTKAIGAFCRVAYTTLLSAAFMSSREHRPTAL